MGVPAFYRWLSEKYPKIVDDVLEERVKLDVHSQRIPLDITQPNPSGLETDNLYIDMNGIIHPCSHPEHGPQPSSEEAMFENVCRYVDHLVCVVRPRRMLFLAIDGVAPRAKMNQQRSRRFRSAQEARESQEIEDHIRSELEQEGHAAPPGKKVWDSNVITPGTSFMLNLSEYIRFYIRKRLSENKAWQSLKIIFSDASIPGEGEHKIMSHVRLQRSQPGYNPNLVHVLHGLDADLIMLALATHEAHFYILREVVVFGRKSQQALDDKQAESGFADRQKQLNEAAGPDAMALTENSFKPLQRVSIPILREYLANEFGGVLKRVPFGASLERLIDDVVFLCFFVGNDFLPHLPSLDIRDGALDYLYNVYKRLLPTLGDYITNHGGKVNLSSVDVILAEVGAIEDYVFQMKYDNEQRQQRRRQEQKQRNKNNGRGNANIPSIPPPPPPPPPPRKGRAARILEKEQLKQLQPDDDLDEPIVALQRGHEAKEQHRKQLKVEHDQKAATVVPTLDDNARAAMELKKSLMGNCSAEIKQVPNADKESNVKEKENEDEEAEFDGDVIVVGEKRKAEELDEEQKEVVVIQDDHDNEEEAAVVVDVDDDEEDVEEGDDDSTSVEEFTDEQKAAAAKQFKEKVKAAKEKQLDQYSKNVEDKVRLHEAGWKDRYYTDKCKADDVANHGGREHLFRSYVIGLCWVMKYYYDGCPSWKWYYPFHYAPFASDLRNIERFEKDCKSFELSEPFKPVEQLMAVLPEDSSHAIPKASRWLMSDEESPIIDFYPKEVPCDPNGKAMPWLWVVLLPFIDEERLLAAMKPTMTKWTKKELLCNARGLDDGYLYVHMSHPLAALLSAVFESNKKDANKVRLRDTARVGFTGSIRQPLSNEIIATEDDAPVPLPASASKLDCASYDNLFGEPIDSNVAVCVSFSEPAKLSHKSILLPGAVVPPPTLTQQDRVIRRPRLNRGGGTIANLGVSSNGRSQQTGYGSMNISSYERDLAQRTGRAGQMYQTGNRAWGAMEPTPKRYRPGDGGYRQPPYQPNPFSQSPATQNYGSSRPPWQNTQSGSYRGAGYQQGHVSQHQHQSRNKAPQSHQPQNRWPPNQGYNSQQQAYHSVQHQQGSRYHNSQQGAPGGRYQHQGPPPPPSRQQQPGQNRQQPHNTGYSFNRPAQQNQPPSRVNPNVMSSLRSQLANTLQQNRRGRGHSRN